MIVGYFVALLVQKYIPHVVVYLITGFLLANTYLHGIDIDTEYHSWFHITELVALGLIGFKIGTELKIEILRKEPILIGTLLILEAGGAFLVVFTLSIIFTGDLLVSLLLGGLATPTAPAATIEVFRKLKTKGPLTTKIQWILAFDDVVAITIIEFILVIARVFLFDDISFTSFFHELFQELGFAILIGVIFGFILDLIVERLEDDLEMMEVTLGVLIFTIGLTEFIGTSVITSAMVVGATVTNLGGDNYRKARDLLDVVMSPIIMFFFVFVGARVLISDFSPFPFMVIIYLFGRILGKIGGSYLGAEICGTDDVIKKNIGLGLLAQGGVALGLSTLVEEMFTDAGKPDPGHFIETTIVIAAIISVALGAFGTAFASKRAGEVGKAKLIDKYQRTDVHHTEF